MPQPNGYRKALRFMRHADKFGFPIITFVDTPGAYAGKNAEELGQVHRISSVLAWCQGKIHLHHKCSTYKQWRRQQQLPALDAVHRPLPSRALGDDFPAVTGRGNRSQPAGDVWLPGAHLQHCHRRGRIRRRPGHWLLKPVSRLTSCRMRHCSWVPAATLQAAASCAYLAERFAAVTVCSCRISDALLTQVTHSRACGVLRGQPRSLRSNLVEVARQGSHSA
jgi:hypothetical protein